MRCTANQTKKKRKQTKKAQNWKSKKSAKLQRTFLLWRTHSHDVGTRTEKTGPKTAALRCRANQTERKQQLAKLASKEAGRTHLAGDDSRQKRSQNKLWKHILLVYIKEHQRQHTRRTATPTKRPPRRRTPPPKRPPPQKTPTDQRQILAWVLEHCHGTQSAWIYILQWIRE